MDNKLGVIIINKITPHQNYISKLFVVKLTHQYVKAFEFNNLLLHSGINNFYVNFFGIHLDKSGFATVFLFFRLAFKLATLNQNQAKTAS